MDVLDLGRAGYAQTYERQLALHEEVLAGSRPDTLILVEHDPVLTLGANFHEANLLLTPREYRARGISVERTDRGGDVTYHGPGQLVIYPIFDLRRHGQDLHRWLRDLEETMLRTLHEFGLEGRRFAPHTGAWLDDLKVAAIGVKVRRWVNLHGIALNVSQTPEAFSLIVPCGIENYGVTSLADALGREVTLDEVKPAVISAFQSVFTGAS